MLDKHCGLTLNRLRSLLRYDSDTGKFYWLVSKGSVKAGKVAGVKRADGYEEIKIDKRSYLTHRLAWLYMTSNWPDDEIDHKRGFSNRFSNLREATHSQNMCNVRFYSHNKSGVKGVYWNNKRKRWQGQIKTPEKDIFVGHFKTLQAATVAIKKMRREIQGEFAR